MKITHHKILITGGAGFVGANLAIGLKKKCEDLQIVAFDNLKRRGSELNIRRLSDCGVKFVHGDVRNYEDLSAIGKVGTIIECSAEPSAMAGYDESPKYLINTNLTGAINCLELARKNDADFIFLSTSRVYPIDKINQISVESEYTRFALSLKQTLPGVSKSGINENFSKDGVRSLYGATKLAAELLLQEYIYAYKIKGVINRCGVIAGPWQMGKVDQGFVSLWVASHFFKKQLDYIGFNGSGKQVRDILHIDDLVDLIFEQMCNIDRNNGEVYNVGGGIEKSISLLELTDICRNISGNKIKIGKIKKNRKADIRIYITDYSKITRKLDWKPVRTVERTVEDTYKWIFDNHRVLNYLFNG